MKRHPHDPLNFMLLRALDEFARSNHQSIMDVAAHEGLLDSFRSSLKEHVSHAARIHGIRGEGMFSHMVAALGEAVLIAEEDSGALFDEAGDLKRPDYRIVTRSREQMLVEVKSFYQKTSPNKPYRMKGAYLASLKRYAALTGAPLRLAIYWSRWNIWTLLDAERLDESQEVISIPMTEAYLHNEMHLLGDRMIATLPPLSFRLYADKTKPRVVKKEGQTGFVVSKACLCCNGVDIDDKEESRIAWYLMMNGSWHEFEQIAEVDNGLLDYIEIRVVPSSPEDDESNQQPFRSLGFLSAMITSQYLRSTSNEGQVTNLAPGVQPDTFALSISDDYRGSVLKLWRFTMLPQHTDPARYL